MTRPTPTAETTAAPTPGAAPLSAGVGHYENFPVASLLCPPALRPAVMAIYHFARTADDIADEGDADATVRLAELAAYRQALQDSLMAGAPISSRWSGIFSPLRQAVQQHGLPAPLLHDLISAFEQDVRHTAAGHHYTDTTELLDYCRLSANPVGRLLLHLYGVHDPASLAQSDQICSALQLINFWQDISVDLPRQRHYLPTEVLRRHGLPREAFDAGASPDAATQVRMAQAMAALCAQARLLMQQGVPLARRIPGRAGWELRLVVQGGLLILDKIAALQHRSWQQRPRVGALDLPRLLWRALCMR
ncbi:MAG: squalene synthase HpnC [Hydrogenophaga sp.]|uniref:squalene synthase HpnC n=1 Tax=Hydrogenophaga sp. TaxID=1904254 RepID=UPI00273220F2|nr:squalene synthase HpnC [Hydrogenophaga sp.]MDP2405658.1 squalene synthase HpnC [Hydrogenophaga sp.]MDZ4176515.1 squalene synthase HpnC [Hydrogenophaga sp.]